MSHLVRSLVRRPVRALAVRLGSSPRRTAVAIAVLFGLSSVFTFAAPSGAFAWDKAAFSSSAEAQLVALTNRSRASAGLKPLRVDSTLRSIARWRSKDMIVRDYFSHTIPGYGKVFTKLHAVGFCYKVAGENIGENNYPDGIATSAIHQQFMGSAGHRANILGKTYDVIGVGAYKGPTGKKMWTVLFADKCGSTSAPAPRPTAKPKPKPRPTTRPTARPTTRPTARPTARPAVAQTPAPTPRPSAAPSPEATAPLSREDLLGPDPAAGPTDGSTDPTTIPGEEPTVNAASDDVVGMRVLDRGSTGGLLETIVGGVTGYFFGG